MIAPFFARIKAHFASDVQRLIAFQNRKPAATLAAMMAARPLLLCCMLLMSSAPAAQAMTNEVSRERDIVGLRLGQRILVDDGTCPAGEIKEVSGAKMTPNGVQPSRRCISRSGPKTK